MDERPESAWLETMRRMQSVTDCRTQQDLAAFLGIGRKALGKAEKRGTVPDRWLLTLLRKKGINPDWIVTGQGMQRLWPMDEHGEPIPASVVHMTEVRPPESCSMEELVTELVRRAMDNLHRE